MLDLTTVRLALLGLAAVTLFLTLFRRKLYPKPVPGIPYNKDAANSLMGDVPKLMPLIKDSGDISRALFAVTTKRLGVPMAQFLFPAFTGRQPMILVADPHEVENILTRRAKEFDRAAFVVDTMGPMIGKGTIGQFTTPMVMWQKRFWSDFMSPEFLRKTAAPISYKSTLELLDLWKLKASTIYLDRPFAVLGDLRITNLDAVWVSMFGEEPELVKVEIQQLQHQISGDKHAEIHRPKIHAAARLVQEQVEFLSDTLGKNSRTLSPKWAQLIESYTPKFRKRRNMAIAEMIKAIERVSNKYGSMETSLLESDNVDTCALDLALRRQILSDRKAGKPPLDPTKDDFVLDEMFTMTLGGYETASAMLAWFCKLIALNPTAQTELRKALLKAFPGQGLPSVDQILETDVPYLNATCQESLRLGSNTGNAREAVVDTTILGVPVSKGTQVFLSYHTDYEPIPIDKSKHSPGSETTAAKHGEGFNGPAGRDPASFKPTRWLVKDPQTGKETFNAYALPFFPFGLGVRGCFGRKLGIMSFRMMVALLILSFEFLELPEELQSMAGTESLVRRPDVDYVRLRVL